MAGENVLLIDTEKNVILAYKAVLEDAGYIVAIATNEKEALEKLSGLQFDIVITELYLKGRDTIALIKEIKQGMPMAGIIVATAANMNVDIYEQIMNAGADSYFTKPFSPNNLLVNIEKVLAKKSLIEKNITLEKRLKKFERFFTTQHYYFSEDEKLSSNLLFNAIIQKEMLRAKRYNREFSVILFEINLSGGQGNKNACDTTAGIADEFIKYVVQRTRKTDIILNLNGHYAIILVETAREGSHIFTRRLMQEISNIPLVKNNLFDHIENAIKIDQITYPEQSDAIQKLLDVADN